MALQPWAIEQVVPHAAEARMLNNRFLPGVVSVLESSFKVQAITPSEGTKVRVGSGQVYDEAYVGGSFVGQGVYGVRNTETHFDVTIPNAHASQNRIDLIVLRAYDDSFDTSGRNEIVAEVVAGTPAASPSAPTEMPPSSELLGHVLVRANTTSIIASDITDKRREFSLSDAAAPYFRAVTVWATGNVDNVTPDSEFYTGWGGEDDPYGMHQGVPDLYVRAPLDGYYGIQGQLAYGLMGGNTPTNTGRMTTKIWQQSKGITGTGYLAGVTEDVKYANQLQQCSAPVTWFNKGDGVLFGGRHDSAGAVRFIGNGRHGTTSWLTMEYRGR